MITHHNKVDTDQVVTDWQIVDGYCATRTTLDGVRVAFVEKTPRVRDPDTGEWIYGPKGTGGSGDNEENGYYGYNERSREWADEKLEELGYSLYD
jgi:hypothetical protein